MDDRDRDLFARFDKNDELIVQFQRGMLAGNQAQVREIERLSHIAEQQRMNPPTTPVATKAKAIGTAIGAVIVFVVGAALQNGWFTEPKPKPPKELPIPVSTYQ